MRCDNSCLYTGHCYVEGDCKTFVGWQKIDNAPKDGTRILMLRHGLISTAWWQNDLHFGGEGWFYPKWDLPTHWMEMPRLPAGY